MKKRPTTTVYLDNAATTYPKPREVINEALRVIKQDCGNPGRSSHRIAMRAAETVFECRRRIANHFGGSEENVIFTSSATHSLNLAIKTTLRRGDHVLISDIEHNSVIRPISALAERGHITFDTYPAHPDPQRSVSAIAAMIRPNTAMVIACHRSNICNLIQPISAIGDLCRRKGILFLVDASQSAGTLPIDMKRDNIDVLCAPGHKGLYGIPGSGFAIFGNRFTEREKEASTASTFRSYTYNLHSPRTLSTFMEGGNGIRSRDTAMPDFLPERLEAGTLAVPNIGALSAGIGFVSKLGEERINRHEIQLFNIISRGFTAFNDHITVHGNGDAGGIALFSCPYIPCEELAADLDGYGICVRAGLHCAPTAHRKLNTPEDGAVRISFGVFNTPKEIWYFLNALETVLKTHRK